MTAAPAGRERVGPALLALVACLGLAAIGFAALGAWQWQRLGWKLALIEKVESRVRAAPVAAPAPAQWPEVSGEEYRRVVVAGRFLHDRETLVQAVTDRGGGFWVMTPLLTESGFTVLVNRGFVPPERRKPEARPQGQVIGDVAVTGLLRLSEPKGGFLRDNDPAAGRWHSRDVAAIAAARGLGVVAPYFIDADATAGPGGYPIGGLTVLRFANNHLVYALTWLALAAMAAAAGVFLARRGPRHRLGDGRDAGEGRPAIGAASH